MSAASAFQAVVQAQLGGAPEHIELGRLHRFSLIGKRGDTAGCCKLFDDGRAGVFSDADPSGDDAAKAFRHLVAEVVLGGILDAVSEPWALAELRIAEERPNAYAKAIAMERAEFIERMKAGRAAMRQREAVQVLCRWPAPSATAYATVA